MFYFDFCFPRATEAVRGRQLQNDRLKFQRINRVCRFDDFPCNLVRTFPDRQGTKECRRILLFSILLSRRPLTQYVTCQFFSIVELDRSIKRQPIKIKENADTLLEIDAL